MASDAALKGRALTLELRKLANEAHTMTDDGTPVTREQVLAQMIWRQALGWEELTRDENGNAVKKTHLPVAWCQQFLFERMEGKVPIATADLVTGPRAADRVRTLAKDRLNRIAEVVSAPTAKPAPVHKPKGS